VPLSPHFPVVVIGAGAAGLMAAACAASGPRPVLLLEGSARPGRKILISGGGRCNVLPSQAAPSDFVSDGAPHLVRRILAAWPLAAAQRYFEADLGVPLRLEAESGKLFPATDRAHTVLDALLTATVSRGVTLRLAARVTGLEPTGDGWTVRLASGEALAAGRVILATGGLSVPATGSDGAGLRLAEALGHRIIPPYPALTPLLGEQPGHRALAGVSLRATARAGVAGRWAAQATGGFLFTHRGYSGPAVLNVSHVAARSRIGGGPRPQVTVQWSDLGAAAWEAELRGTVGPLLPLLRRRLPERLAGLLLAETGLTEVAGAHLRREERLRLVEALCRYALPWTGDEGYRTAEVTGGGVALGEVDPASLQSRRARGLYLCGEILDAFGPIGGYNFLWAWVTGRSAGLAAGQV
jgi:hypothetical protein